MPLTKITKHWLKGLIGAAIASAANSVSVMIVDPKDFNLHAGLAKLASVAIASAIVGMGLYLAKSPLPPDEEV